MLLHADPGHGRPGTYDLTMTETVTGAGRLLVSGFTMRPPADSRNGRITTGAGASRSPGIAYPAAAKRTGNVGMRERAQDGRAAGR
jgi:hypothetical protein